MKTMQNIIEKLIQVLNNLLPTLNVQKNQHQYMGLFGNYMHLILISV